MKTILFILIAVLCFQIHAQNHFKYRHILITNDDGIEDAGRLIALAKKVKTVAEKVSVIVSSTDKSGTSNHTTYGKHQSILEITCTYADDKNNIAIYTTPGNPADCVLLGVMGFFPGHTPDLVLSGINGGANIGPGWFGSGTIGAVRMAAFLGVKAIAFSGFNDEDKECIRNITAWITAFISSKVTNEIKEHGYITVGFPNVSPKEIKGIKIVDRKISYKNPTAAARFTKISGDNPYLPQHTTAWTLKYVRKPAASTKKYDEDYLKEGYIIITPMTIDENNPDVLTKLHNHKMEIPEFSITNHKKNEHASFH